MSTERSTFGLNSILPSTYRNKAEAFAKCLQDKLRSLSGLEDSTDSRNGSGLLDETPATPHGSFSKYSEEEIADSVFLQGPLAYKRKSIPERTGPPPTNGRYVGSVTDRRGLSSDSEDSDNDDILPSVENAVHRRITQLQTQQQRDSHKRLTSVNSVDSTTSWCSCEDPDEEEDEEVIDSLASQIKGSPTIHNPRLRNFKRKGNKGAKEEIPASAPAENDLFFDFDVECFSPVNLDGEGEDVFGFDTAQLHFKPDNAAEYQVDETNVVDTGQEDGLLKNIEQEVVSTPRSSPVLEIYKSAQVKEYPALQLMTKNEIQYDNVIINDDNNDIENSTLAEQGNTCEEGVELPTEGSSLSECILRRPNENEENIDDSLCSENPDLCVHKSFDEIEKHETETNEKVVPYEDNENEKNPLSEEVFEENNLLADAEEFTNDVEMTKEIVQETVADYGQEKEEPTVIPEIVVEDEPAMEDLPSTSEMVEVATESESVPCDTADETLSFGESQEDHKDISSNTTEEKVQATGIASIVITKCDDNDNDTDDSISPRMKLRRCSSLKTWKTPPGTPGRKKIVRFADALGLDLADVRTFLDELPKIPRSAFEDLNYEPPPVVIAPPPTERTLIPMFQQPGTQIDFLHRVRQNNVSLESAVLTDVSLLAISGMVRVRNLSFYKSVHIRYTKDAWVTFSDLQATFIPGSGDGFCDNFSFTLYGHTLNIGDRLEFAIRYECGNGQFWDNNGGINYVFQCMPRSPMPLFPPLGTSLVSESWTNFY